MDTGARRLWSFQVSRNEPRGNSQGTSGKSINLTQVRFHIDPRMQKLALTSNPKEPLPLGLVFSQFVPWMKSLQLPWMRISTPIGYNCTRSHEDAWLLSCHEEMCDIVHDANPRGVKTQLSPTVNDPQSCINGHHV